MSPPLADQPHEPGFRPRGQWSHSFRPLPHDGGCLPIALFVAAVLATGFRGYFGIKVFDGQFEQKYGDDLQGHAQKAPNANANLIKEAIKIM